MGLGRFGITRDSLFHSVSDMFCKLFSYSHYVILEATWIPTCQHSINLSPLHMVFVTINNSFTIFDSQGSYSYLHSSISCVSK